jgi:hypothetical protein
MEMERKMRKKIIFALLAVTMLLISSFAMAVKPESPHGLSKDKNIKAPGQWKKTIEFESQKHFVNEIHTRILSRMAERLVFPHGLMRLVSNFLLLIEQIDAVENEEKSKVEVTGDINLSAEGNETIRQLMESLNGTEGKQELKLKIKKQNGTVTIERNDTTGNLTEDQQILWNNLVDIVEILIKEAEGDDLELEIEIEHELEIEEEVEEPEIENPEPIE